MAAITLSNIAKAAGVYDLLPTTLTSDAVVTQIISGLTIVKTADKQVWADDTFLQYTITVTNNAESAYTGIVITDILDIVNTSLVDGSVKVNGEDGIYTLVDDLLTITNTPDLEAGETAIITFQLQKN